MRVARPRYVSLAVVDVALSSFVSRSDHAFTHLTPSIHPSSEQVASPSKAHVPFRGSSEAHREFHAHNLRDARQPPSPQKGLDHLRNKATFTATTRNQNDFRAPSASDYERPLHPPQHERGSVPFMGETTNHHDFVGHEPAHSRPRSPLKGKYAPSSAHLDDMSMYRKDFGR